MAPTGGRAWTSLKLKNENLVTHVRFNVLLRFSISNLQKECISYASFLDKISVYELSIFVADVNVNIDLCELQVFIPSNCIIGEWNFAVSTKSFGKDKDGNDTVLRATYKHKADITILFNPWCKGMLNIN